MEVPFFAPGYLRDFYYPTLGTRGCSSLRSMERCVLFVSLPVLNLARLVHSRCLAPLFGMGFHWRLLLRVHSDAFYSSLKTALFSHARVGSSSEYSNLEEAPYKST